MKLRKKLGLVLSSVLLLGALGACSSSSSESGSASGSNSTSGGSTSATATSAVSEGILNIAGEVMPSTLDPAIGWDGWYVVRYGVGETLVKLDDYGNYEPWLATHWEFNEDATEWVFYLEKDVKFSNGEDMTATKVKESIDRLYELNDPANGGAGNPQGYFVYTSLEADDEAGTITIQSESPVIDMPGCLAYPWMAVMDVAAAEGVNVAMSGPVGTGPYVVSEFLQDSHVIFEGNEHFWGGEVPFEKINYVLLGDSKTRSLALQDGSADMAINLAQGERESIEKAGDFQINVIAGGRTGMGHMNHDGILSNQTLREAIIMAIDGEAIAEVTTGGAYLYGYSALPTHLDYGGNSLEFNHGYDPEGAMALLDSAGIVDTDGDGWREIDGKNIEINYVSAALRYLDVVGQAHVALIREIGIDATLNMVDSTQELLYTGAFDIVATSELTIPTGDPQQYLNHWYTDALDNYASYSNSEYDAIYEQLGVTVDQEVRKELIKQLQQILLDDAVAVTVGYFTANICSSSQITGAKPSTSDFYWITPDLKPAN